MCINVFIAKKEVPVAFRLMSMATIWDYLPHLGDEAVRYLGAIAPSTQLVYFLLRELRKLGLARVQHIHRPQNISCGRKGISPLLS